MSSVFPRAAQFRNCRTCEETRSLRIIAGKFRRRKLLVSPGDVTRPITDKVKEVLFERIEQEFPGSHVADVFAGTGSLGLEALSRGARTVAFLENNRQAYHLLQQNVATLGVDGDTLCWRVDVLRSSFRPKGVPGLLPYDVVFFDPPFHMVPGIRPSLPLYKSLERLARDGVTADDALLLLRTPPQAEFQFPDIWVPDQTMSFRNMKIHLFDKRTIDAEPKDDTP